MGVLTPPGLPLHSGSAGRPRSAGSLRPGGGPAKQAALRGGLRKKKTGGGEPRPAAPQPPPPRPRQPRAPLTPSRRFTAAHPRKAAQPPQRGEAVPGGTERALSRRPGFPQPRCRPTRGPAERLWGAGAGTAASPRGARHSPLRRQPPPRRRRRRTSGPRGQRRASASRRRATPTKGAPAPPPEDAPAGRRNKRAAKARL